MATSILATKLYIPPPRPRVVFRPRLVERITEGLHRKLTLISAPAGFGKTTLVSEWVAGNARPVAWLSLDAGDNDPKRFLTYLIAALQTISQTIGVGVLGVLQSPQSPPTEAILTALLNEITTISGQFTLILDDYHLIESSAVNQALTFLLDHLPPQVHLLITSREDPQISLSRLRVRDQLTELRVADLRFTLAETAGFLNHVMDLHLSAPDIAALEARTEGWIAGLQLAAISMRGHHDTARFITSFTGSHRFVFDYLAEEILQQQPASVQSFLLRTSILDRMCGPLCDAIVRDPALSGQATLELLERANLFIVPLDNERRWYRYHHLFADLLGQRMRQTAATEDEVAELHRRASAWYEANGLDFEAFHHATAANDIEHAARLVEGVGMPLHFRGAAVPVLSWLESLPPSVLDARPVLWVMGASALLFVSQLSGIEQRLQAAEAALHGDELDERARDLIGHIASIRATVAVTQHDLATIVAQSRRALEYLHPDNLPVRTATTWTLGYAYHLQGDRAAAGRAYSEAIAISQAIGHFMINLLATIGLGNVQESENLLALATQTYHQVLAMAGDPPLPVACEAHLGLAHIAYEWNDLATASDHARQSVHMSRQLENTDRVVACEVFLARLRLAQGDVTGAATMLAQSSQFARQHQFIHSLPEVAAAQVLVLLRQGHLVAAARLAQSAEIPLSQARVHLAQGDASSALAVLVPFRRQVEAKGWQDERIRVMVLQSLALQSQGDRDEAVQLLSETLVLAEPGGLIRSFVDEGVPMMHLLSEVGARGVPSAYRDKVLSACEAEASARQSSLPSSVPSLIEPLSHREREVLSLIAQGLSNHEISERLFLALSTVKGHNRQIFDKLQVQRRTEAVARARELGLL